MLLAFYKGNKKVNETSFLKKKKDVVSCRVFIDVLYQVDEVPLGY